MYSASVGTWGSGLLATRPPSLPSPSDVSTAGSLICIEGWQALPSPPAGASTCGVRFRRTSQLLVLPEVSVLQAEPV